MSVPNQKARKVMNFQSKGGRSRLLRVNVVQNTIEQQPQARSGGLRIIVKGKLVKDCESTGEYRFANSGGDQISVIQALNWVLRNTAGDRYETFLSEHRALCD